MAYQNDHVKVTIFGDCFNGQEEWSTGFHMGSVGEGAGNFGVNADWVNALAAAWQTFFTLSGNGFSTKHRTLGVKAGVVRASDGKFNLDSIITRTYATPIVGANGGAALPPQVTLVASLETANRRELGGRGRMYLPGINFGLPDSGHLGSIECQRVADNLRTFLDAVEIADGSPGYVMIASQGRKKDGVQTSPPVNRRVTNVRVGDVYDTQRRRRNQLTETYYNSTLSAAPV